MKILSWNVNGLRAVARKGFLPWLTGGDADVVCVQEVRARPDQLDEDLRSPPGWHTAFEVAERKGYSGVGCFSRRPIDEAAALGVVDVDAEGRVQLLSFGDLLIANVYFPNGNGTVLPTGRRSNDRVPYKLSVYRALWSRLEADKERGRPILVLGDFNTAPYPIDLARPKQNKATSGFLPQERAELIRWFDSGWVDTFRASHPAEPDHYSWWSTRKTVRERNIGWRLDLILASPGAAEHVQQAFIQRDVMGSDHCPVGVVLDLPAG